MNEFDAAFATMTSERAGGVFVISGPSFFSERHRLADLALKRSACISRWNSSKPEACCPTGRATLAYFRQAAHYVDKILGAGPGDLPIEQPTEYELVVNLKTAKPWGSASRVRRCCTASRSIQ